MSPISTKTRTKNYHPYSAANTTRAAARTRALNKELNETIKRWNKIQQKLNQNRRNKLNKLYPGVKMTPTARHMLYTYHQI